jgi:predicted HTH transcriptional regulator
LHGLISQGEHQQQDFKYKVTDAVKLARSVSAFANTEGGRLLIGVRDDGHLSGVRSEEEIFMMHQAAWKYCQPASSIKFDNYRVEGRNIVIATVPMSNKRPICAIDDEGRQRAYVRIADENIVASPVHLAIWREEQQLHGASFTYGDDERQLMAVLEETPQPLNKIVRRSRLPRPKVVMLLARLIRYGLVGMSHGEQSFVFALVC